MKADLVLCNASVVTDQAVLGADIAVRGGRITALSLHGEEHFDAEEQLDLRGLHVFPGGIDPHVHFGDQSQAAFEDFASGTRAAAAGGITTVCDMPLNMPPTIDPPTFEARRAAVSPHAYVDFGLWAGLVPGNREQFARLAQLGAMAFKAFTCEAADWFEVQDDDLLEGMREAARLGLPVGVHCENNAIIAYLRRILRAAGRKDLRAHLESRPEVAELEAISRVVLLGKEAGARTHIVHVSIAEGVDAVRRMREQGVQVTAEVTMHHLTLDDEDAVRVGSRAKCAPPLRARHQVDALWRRVRSGYVHTIGSDHSPATDEQKDLSLRDHWEVPDGITGVQTLLPLLLTEGVHKRGLSLPRVVSLSAANAARTFGLFPGKGAIQVGSDADFAVVDLYQPWTLQAEHLFYKWPWSAHLGWHMTGRVVRTIVRGRTVFLNGEVVGDPGYGLFLSPLHGSASAT